MGLSIGNEEDEVMGDWDSEPGQYPVETALPKYYDGEEWEDRDDPFAGANPHFTGIWWSESNRSLHVRWLGGPKAYLTVKIPKEGVPWCRFSWRFPEDAVTLWSLK